MKQYLARLKFSFFYFISCVGEKSTNFHCTARENGSKRRFRPRFRRSFPRKISLLNVIEKQEKMPAITKNRE